MALVKRSDKVAYFGVGGSTATSYDRMIGFTNFSTSKNPQEYNRRYVDEVFEQTDVIGYAPSIAYAFDQTTGNDVHDDIVGLTEAESTGSDMIRTIVIVDFTNKDTDGAYIAKKRDFAIIPDSEGDGTDAYTFSGTLKVKGPIVTGTATISNDGATATFTADSD